MDEILHADDAKLAKSSLNQVVGGDGSAVAVDLRHDVETLFLFRLCWILFVKIVPSI